MKGILSRFFDRACVLYPQVGPVLFMDDLAAEMTGPSKHIVQQLGGYSAGGGVAVLMRAVGGIIAGFEVMDR